MKFTIEEHQTTRFHYDFRIQAGNIWYSWSIPKGFQDDPKVKRLAFKTISGEEKIGEGEVYVLDEGAYEPEIEFAKGVRRKVADTLEGERIIAEGIEKGEIKFYLLGKKVQGSFALIKTKGFPPGKTNAWLLIKHK